MIRSDYCLSVAEERGELPAALRRVATLPFVGREAELTRLRTLMPSAAGEAGRLALLAGDPGSGKSRLVRELAASAVEHERALVLYGACDAAVRTPYGPFAQALEPLTGPRLLPDLPAAGEGAARREAEDPDTERHRVHTAVAALLAEAGRAQPLLLVLEDVHWADTPSLLLLGHLARSAAEARLLLVATFRDTETEAPRALAETLADLHRSEHVVRLRLEGLSAAEVGELTRGAAGCESGPELTRLADSMRELTGGNPFLVGELWRALSEAGAVEVGDGVMRLVRPPEELASPESVREVAGQRIARLAPATTGLLELAAVAGAEFEFDLLRRAAGLGEAELLAALDEAVASGMLEELPSSPGLTCRFTHELVRRALYDGLSRGRRAELHLRVGEALEESDARSGRDLADLAHHFAAAAPLGDARRAVEHNLRAARAAAAALAFEEAAQALRAALGLRVDDPAERAEAFLELGTVSHRAGNATDALEAFERAAEIARRLGSAELLARAAIGYEDACWRPGIALRDSVELLEEAIAALGEERPALRVELLAGLARALDFQGERRRGAIVRGNAVALARRLEDRVGLAKVLVRAYWSRGTSPLEEILAMLSEARDLAEELRDEELRTEAISWRAPTFVALCDLDSARADVIALSEMAERTGQPFMNHVAAHYGSALALGDGRLAEAEALARRSEEWGRLLTGRDASGIFGIQMFSVRREQGRLAELAPATRILAGEASREGPWLPGLIALLAELGMEAEARRELERLATAGLDGFRASLWQAGLAYLADAAAALGDERMAALVYPELEPLAGGNVMVGHLVACYGAADRYLGMLAATLGETERAEQHFERALELNRRMRAPTWVAHTAYEYGRLLVGRPGGRPRAEALLGEAGELAARIGMESLAGRVRGLGTVVSDGGLPDELSPREAQVLALIARGMSNREIGEALTISEHTAANHVRSILRKSGCANRTEAASYAHRHGLASA